MEPDVVKGRYWRILSLLFTITKAVNRPAPLGEQLAAIAEAAAQLVGASGCSILLLDETRGQLLARAAFGPWTGEAAGIGFQLGEGVAGWVAEHNEVANVPDVLEDRRFKRLDGAPPGFRSLMSVPLTNPQGSVIGVVSVTDAARAAFGPGHEELLAYLGSSLVQDIENARLFRQAVTDPLTLAYNRQLLHERLFSEIDRCRRYRDPLCVALFDIDHFRRFNDDYGRPAGDFMLKEVARIAQGQIRETDTLVRFGSEEFLFLLPSTPVEGASVFAERFRTAVGSADLPWGDVRLKVTVSVGLAMLDYDNPTVEALLLHADEALHAAKSEGRNRVVVYRS